MDLKQKTIENTFIVFIVTFINRGLNIITKILLARLLFPEDFGLIAIAMIIINAIALFREMGIESALVYRKDQIKEAADTAFIMLPFIGISLYTTAFLLAPYAAEFYNESAIDEIIKISGITLILTSFSSIPITLFAKNLNFKKRMTPEVVSNISYSIITVFLALQGFRVWSLVYGGLAAGFIGLVTVWAITPYRPSLRFDKKLAMEMITYGKYVLGAQIVIFILINIDNAVIGKILDIRALGYYAMAYSIANLPATNITHILGKILFPTYSKLQDDKKKFSMLFLKVVEYVSFLTVPASFMIFIFSPELIQYVIGIKWIPALIPLRILCIAGMLRSVTATTGDVFKAIGKPKLLQDISLVQLAFMVIFIVPAAHYGGLSGVSILMVLKSTIAFILAVYIISKQINITLIDIYSSLKNQFISSFLSSLVVTSIGLLYSSTGFLFILKIIIFGLCYLFFYYLLNRKIFSEFINLLKCVRPE